MDTDVERLLREGMERFTADLRAPAGLTRRATRRRRRRLALRSGWGGAAVLAAGAVALAVVVPGAGDSAQGLAAAAYVVKRVDSALTTAEPGAIAQVTVTTSGLVMPGGLPAPATAREWSYRDQWRSVSYSRAGYPVYDEGTSASSVYTLVSYPTRTWARQRRLGRPLGLTPGGRLIGKPPAGRPVLPGVAAGSGTRGCGQVTSPGRPVPEPDTNGQAAVVLPMLFQPGLPGIGFSASSPPATVARDLRTAISCGSLAVAGRQRVDGIKAIELTSRSNGQISETIWVSPGTYLPVRVVLRRGAGQPALLTASIRWLTPTAQNLAKLTVPVPAGFRRVSLADALGQFLLIPGILGGPGPTTCLQSPAGRRCLRGSGASGAGR